MFMLFEYTLPSHCHVLKFRIRAPSAIHMSFCFDENDPAA